jgi:hypothetical protein
MAYSRDEATALWEESGQNLDCSWKRMSVRPFLRNPRDSCYYCVDHWKQVHFLAACAASEPTYFPPLCNLGNGPIANDHSQRKYYYGAYA